ncbi:uncharacterized protein LOC127865849 [Dreissena polymorpha]|nr:uncharacterized protein LOC127865849 [Dreissena polymorpha]
MLKKEDDTSLPTVIHHKENETSLSKQSDIEPFHSTDGEQEWLEIPNPMLCDSIFNNIITPGTCQKMTSDVDVNRKCFSLAEIENVEWRDENRTGPKAVSDVQTCDEISSEEDEDRTAGKISTLETTKLILGDVKQCEAEILSNLERTKSIKVSVRKGAADSEISWDEDEDDGSQKSLLPVKMYAPTTELNADMMKQLGVIPTEPYEQENERATKGNFDTQYGQIAQKEIFWK